MFVPKSNSISSSLSQIIWDQYYYKPINKFGYRDYDFTSQELLKKQKIIILGDSFTEGFGLKKTAQRFSNLLAQKVSDKYIVLNFGKRGSNTKDMFKRLTQSPVQADLLILQYFVDDFISPNALIYAEPFHGSFPAYSDVPSSLQYFIKYSFFLNYIYWQSPHAYFKTYSESFIPAWGNEEVRNNHLSDLNDIIDFCEKNSTSLIVLTCPAPGNYDFDKIVLSTIEEFFAKKRVPVISVKELMADLSFAQSVINKSDIHYSPLLNSLIAEELYKFLCEELKIIDG